MTLLVPTRRGFLGLLAAPAIVRFASLMPVRSWIELADRVYIGPEGAYIRMAGGKVSACNGLSLYSPAPFARMAEIMKQLKPGGVVQFLAGDYPQLVLPEVSAIYIGAPHHRTQFHNDGPGIAGLGLIATNVTFDEDPHVAHQIADAMLKREWSEA